MSDLKAKLAEKLDCEDPYNATKTVKMPKYTAIEMSAMTIDSVEDLAKRVQALEAVNIDLVKRIKALENLK